jgi:predicted DNA-binding transcriptional regulator AlpA
MSSILTPKAVAIRTSVSWRTIQRWVIDGAFPQPLKLGSARIGFLEAEVDDWIAALPRAQAGEARP